MAFLGGSGWELGCGFWCFVYGYVCGYGWRIDLCYIVADLENAKNCEKRRLWFDILFCREG